MPLRKQETVDASVRTAVAGNTATALDLYGQLRGAEGNLFFSPFSVSAALAMTYGGARGDTALQMTRALHFTLEQEIMHPAFSALRASLELAEKTAENVRLRIANALWPQAGYPFLEAFLSLVERYYGSAVFPIDYCEPEEACARINAWVEEQTAQKIRDLLRPGDLDPLTTLVLVNAIYFRGNWSLQFDASQTRMEPFSITPTHQMAVPMMVQTGTCPYKETETAQIVELTCAGDRLAMLLVLPWETAGLSTVESGLTVAELAGWIDGLRAREVQVALPRFKMSCKFELKPVLAALGMHDAFTARANFAGMDGREAWLSISKVLHKAYLDVNEEGAEAAAATAVIMKRLAAPPLTPSVRFDHPFLLLIRDRGTGSLLFLGRVVDPLAAGE